MRPTGREHEEMLQKNARVGALARNFKVGPFVFIHQLSCFYSFGFFLAVVRAAGVVAANQILCQLSMPLAFHVRRCILQASHHGSRLSNAM